MGLAPWFHAGSDLPEGAIKGLAGGDLRRIQHSPIDNPKYRFVYQKAFIRIFHTTMYKTDANNLNQTYIQIYYIHTNKLGRNISF